MSKEQTFKERVVNAQNELKAPKGQYNSFGRYKYRSAEDILEAVKPVNAKHGLTLTVSDNIEMVGERVYIKAIATLSDVHSDECLIVTAFAREQLSKKGMDESQITGSASSYARKYALNGLYLIDDTKDADTDEQRNQTTPLHKQTNQMSKEDFTGHYKWYLTKFKDVMTAKEVEEKLRAELNITSKTFTAKYYVAILDTLQKWVNELESRNNQA